MTGYKDPPKEHQFKKGNKGKPKGAISLKTRIENALLKSLEYPDLTKPKGSGAKKKGSMLNFMIDALIAQSLKGNTKAFEILTERVYGKIATKLDINDPESYVKVKEKIDSRFTPKQKRDYFELQAILDEE